MQSMRGTFGAGCQSESNYKELERCYTKFSLKPSKILLHLTIAE